MIKEFTGIVLCGGKSLRMGTDKALLRVKNNPMVSYPLEILRQWCSEILISANDSRLDFLDYPVIQDEIMGIGPMGGLYTCLRRSKHEWSIVLACDMPLITGALIQKMAVYAQNCDAVVPVVNQRPEPLYGLYRKTIISGLEKSIDKRIYSIQKLLSQANVRYIEPQPGEIYELLNVNTPSELLKYEQAAE